MWLLVDLMINRSTIRVVLAFQCIHVLGLSKLLSYMISVGTAEMFAENIQN